MGNRVRKYQLYKPFGKYIFKERDIKILRHIADGLTHHEIAAEMGLSYATIVQYIWYMNFDLDARSPGHLVAMAYDLGILIPKIFIRRPERKVAWKKPPKRFLRDAGDMVTGRKYQM